MAKEKVTITLDPLKADHARPLLGARSASEAIDLALDRLIHTEQLRRDIAAYGRIPPTGQKLAVALLADTGGLADETGWDYPQVDTNQ